MFTGENAVQSKLLYRGYQLEVRREPAGWRVEIYPRTADLPILSRCEVISFNLGMLAPSACCLTSEAWWQFMNGYPGRSSGVEGTVRLTRLEVLFLLTCLS